MKERLELPQLSLKERDRRWKAIREAMKTRGLDCLVVTAKADFWGSGAGNVRYICNYGEDSYCVFPLEGEPTYFMWSRCMEPFIRGYIWVEDVRPGAPFYNYAVAERIKELGYEKGNIGIVGLTDFTPLGEGTTPYTFYTSLQKRLSQANFQDATDLLIDIQLVKSPEEVAFIEKAAELGDMAVEVMAREAKAGAKESVIYADMIHEMLVHGSEYPPMIIEMSGPIVRQGAYIPQQRILQSGDVMLAEFYPRYGGYWGHINQPLAIGKIHKDYERCLEVCLESIENGMKSLVPGKLMSEVAQAFEEPVLKAGCYWDAPAIHGLNLAIPAPPLAHIESPNIKVQNSCPGWSFYRVPEFSHISFPDMTIKAGMVFGIEPTAAIGERGIHIGPNVVITETGPRQLSKYGRDLIRV